MKVETKIFTTYHKNYKSLIELSLAMEVTMSHINQVLEGSRQIGHAFIAGAHKAFPDRNLGDLFYLTDETLHEPEAGADVGAGGAPGKPAGIPKTADLFRTIRRQADAK